MTTILSKIQDWLSTIWTHLWLSVSSINFYQRVILSYTGYGLKYIMTLSFIASMFCSIMLLNYFDNLERYFTYGTTYETLLNLDHVLPSVADVDHVISQIPDLKYDGNSISLDSPDPIYINGINNQIVAAIDPENKLSSSERAKILFLFTKKKLVFSFRDVQDHNLKNIALEYRQLFDKENTLITQEIIRSLIQNLLGKIPKAIIYGIFPTFGLMIFFNILLEKSFIIIGIYLMTYFLNMNSSIKTCIRVTMFSSGILAILQLPVFFIAPTYTFLVWLIQIWATFLMVIGIIRISNQNFFKFKK